MSFLFKMALGDKVVHPSGNGSNANQSPQNRPTQPSLQPRAAAAVTPESVNGRSSMAYSASSAREGADSELRSNGLLFPSSRSTPAVAASSPPSPAKRAPSRPPPTTEGPRPTTPTRTLLQRVANCTVTQDLRDALRELLRCPDLPYCIDAEAVRALTGLLTNYSDEESIAEPSLQLLEQATDLERYPSQVVSNRGTVEVTLADKRHSRDELLELLINDVPLLLHSMAPSAPSSCRYHAVLLLQRLEEYEPFKVSHALLASRSVGVLLDALNDVDSDDLLRSETLVLLTTLTMTDRELQTLLAFDNAFESLFDLVQRVGGTLSGGAMARDALTVVHNILRSNKATQKFFREMGCASRLAGLLEAVPDELVGVCTTPGVGKGRPPMTPSSWPQPSVDTMKTQTFLQRTGDSDAMLNGLMVVSILACVLRGCEEAEEERCSTQDALLRCGLLCPLSRLACCGLAIDDATRIEAVRVLAALLGGSKRAVEEWLSLPPVLTLVRATAPYAARLWYAPRALLSYVCETSDTTLVSGGVQLLLALLSVPACHERVLGVLLEGLVGKPVNVETAPSTGAVPALPPSARSSDPRCGAGLARLLLSSSTPTLQKYYTAQVLRMLFSLPAAAKISESLVRMPVPVELQEGSLDGFVKAQPGWSLSSFLRPSFFNYYVSFLLFCISGAAASQQMDTATLGAYVAVVLAWMGICPWAAAALVEDAAWGETLLHQTRRDGAVHLRLWSAMLIARGCMVVSAAAVPTSPHPESVAGPAADALMRRFLQTVGGGAALDTILFDAQASTPAWQHPVASGLRATTPTVYDAAFVAQVEQLVGEFKLQLSAVANAEAAAGGRASPSRSSLPPLVRPVPSLTSSYVHESGPALHAVGTPVLTSPPPSQWTQPSPKCADVGPAADGAVSMPSGDHRLSAAVATATQTVQPTYETATGHQAEAAAAGETKTLIASLRAQLQEVQTERQELLRSVDDWRVLAERREAECEALQQAQLSHTAALTAAEAEAAQYREAAAAVVAVQSAAASSEMVADLKENIHLLEEALRSKEEEHQQLVESLYMMENQLRHATEAAAAANEQHAAARSAAALAQQQPPSPPPQAQAPTAPQIPPEMLQDVEQEREALHHRLTATQQESGRLQHSLQKVTADLNELLIMVAELNAECLSVRANSSVNATPSRQVAEWMAAAAAQERYDETLALGGEGGIHACVPAPVVEEGPEPLQNSLPAESGETWQVTESPNGQLMDIARHASAIAYAAATDVEVGFTDSQPTETLTAPAGFPSYPPPPPPPQLRAPEEDVAIVAPSTDDVLGPVQQPSVLAPPPPPVLPSAAAHSRHTHHQHGAPPHSLLASRRLLSVAGGQRMTRYANPFGEESAPTSNAQLRGAHPPMPSPGTVHVQRVLPPSSAHEAQTGAASLPAPPSQLPPEDPYARREDVHQPELHLQPWDSASYAVQHNSASNGVTQPMDINDDEIMAPHTQSFGATPPLQTADDFFGADSPADSSAARDASSVLHTALPLGGPLRLINDTTAAAAAERAAPQSTIASANPFTGYDASSSLAGSTTSLKDYVPEASAAHLTAAEAAVRLSHMYDTAQSQSHPDGVPPSSIPPPSPPHSRPVSALSSCTHSISYAAAPIASAGAAEMPRAPALPAGPKTAPPGHAGGGEATAAAVISAHNPFADFGDGDADDGLDDLR